MGKIISLHHLAGGIDTSVLAVNIAASLAAQSGKKVALLDLSFSGTKSLESVLNFKPQRSLPEVADVLDKLDEKLIQGYLPEHELGLVCTKGTEVFEAEKIDARTLARIIKIVSSAYPFSFLLLPNWFPEYKKTIIGESDIVLLSVAPHMLSVNDANLFLSDFKSWYFPLSMVRNVLSKNNFTGAMSASEISALTGATVVFEIDNDEKTISESINSGKPAAVSLPHSDFSVSIKKLSKTIMDGSIFSGITREKSVAGSEPAAENKDTGVDNKQEIKILKEKLHQELIAKLNVSGESDFAAKRETREKSRDIILDLLSKHHAGLERSEKEKIVEELLNEVFGLGCMEVFLKDDSITEIMVNGPENIYVEKKGKLQKTAESFTSSKQLMTVIDRIVSPLGRRVDESSPIVDARLADGSRVNAIIQPVSLAGPAVTIRKFSKKKLQAEDLVNFGALKMQMADFLRICVKLRKNIIISGGTGSGKTTLLNVVSSFIPEDERIVTIEDSAELKLPQEHVVRLEARPPSIEGTGEVSIRRLVINALRMRPDRIVVGECRSGETLDMLQAMNTGHDGSLTTIHSNSPKDAIGRITTMVMMAGMDLPERAIKEQIASAVNIIVQLSRQSDGSRKIIDISEITGIKNEAVELLQIFKYEQTGIKDGKVAGRFTATGNLPTFCGEIETHGLSLDKGIFIKGELK